MSNQKTTPARRGTKLASMLPTTPVTPRFKPKSTLINACYTPSSLYRNTGIHTNFALRTTKDHETATANTEVSNLTVAVRVRPSVHEEQCTSNLRILVEDNEISFQCADSGALRVTHSFVYDKVYDSRDSKQKGYANQQIVFAGTAQPLLDCAFAGYNACLFAYGQTGSGKSFSMIGMEKPDLKALDDIGLHMEAGIIPRLCNDLFNRIDRMKPVLQAEVEISYFEIYNEKIYDLLHTAGKSADCSVYEANNFNCTPQRSALKVREHPLWGPYIVDLSVHPVDSFKALQNWLTLGHSNRATAATVLNDKSSRSHSILNIILTLTEVNENNMNAHNGERQTRRSKISLVDLAGSERINAATATGDRLREGVSINKSLLTLGKVIAALSDAKWNNSSASTFIPYRESVLTWLLRENLGGNSKTAMLATISPASIHIDETLATLRYACQARRIVNRVHVNESPHDKLIRELRAEIERLRALHNEYNRQKRISGNNLTPRSTNPRSTLRVKESVLDDKEVEALGQQLQDREKELMRAQRTWTERLVESDHQQKSEMHMLRRKGLALELSAVEKQACLINLAADPILSGIMFYILPAGKVRIGRARNREQCKLDIVLDGPLVAHNHCVIENVQGKLTIAQENEHFETYLNGELITKHTTSVYHGDRLVIGGTHYFRISNPFCTRSKIEGNKKVADFQYAYQEILKKQEEKLRNELEKEKIEALSRIELERAQNERNFKDRLQELELEQLKFKCNREILESERKAFQQDTTSERNISPLVIGPFKSTIFEDISSILQNPSKESLHKTQLMVKEATQRCRDLGINLEFRQSKVVDEFGIFRTVILILDKTRQIKAEWPSARLSVWLGIVRETEHLTQHNLFTSVDVEWEPLSNHEASFDSYDSPNTSGISLNLSIVKDSLLKQEKGYLCAGRKLASPLAPEAFNTMSPQLQLRTRNLLSLYKSPTTPSRSATRIQNFTVKAAAIIDDLQMSAIRLKKLCIGDYGGNSLVNASSASEISESIQQLELIFENMRFALNDENADESTKGYKTVRFSVD